MTIEQQRYAQWVETLKDFPGYAKQLAELKDNTEEIQDRFYQDLSFGTAGLRGLLGVGTNRMNVFTVGRATQGLASYWVGKKEHPQVAIGFDSRHFSPEFAEHAATIFAANGMTVHLFPQLCPTPTLAFAVRKLGCDLGVMITASHNPAQYNGYKVFGADGCQIDDEVAEAVLQEINQTDLFTGVKKMNRQDAIDTGRLNYIPKNMGVAFCDQVFLQTLQPRICREAALNVVYTPLNGTGNMYVQDLFGRLGITDFRVVPGQEQPDGNFPTCPYPNPEFPEALALGLALAKSRKADFLLATDPDADRVAIAVAHKGAYQILSGNQLGVLLLDYIAATRLQLGTLPKNPVAVRSIVSTKLFDRVAASYGVEVRDVLTGFKFIGEVIGQLEQEGEIDRFILGFEEACGFLVGTHVRDKDAIVATALTCEMLASHKIAGKTAVDRLDEIAKEQGYFSNLAQNLVFEGQEGMAQMNQIMATLRSAPPKAIVGRQVVAVLDYQTGIRQEGDQQSKIPTRPSNVLEYHLEDGCGIIIRPSGTEPKLKIYYSLIGSDQQAVDQLEKEYKAASVELAGVEL